MAAANSLTTQRSGSSTGKPGRLPTTQIAISELMADGAARKPSEVAEILGLNRGAASAAMGRMARAGALEKLGAGMYRRENVERLRPDTAPTPAPLPIDSTLTPTESGSEQQQEPPDPSIAPLTVDPSPPVEGSATKPQSGSLRDDVARAAFAAKLWLKDAARLRFGDYHWEKRRRRMHDRDRKTGRAPAR